MAEIPVLIPEMPTAEEILPWLQQIDQRKQYSNFGPLCVALAVQLQGGFSNAPQVVPVGNGTIAIQLALMALDLPKHARVLVPNLTFVGTASAVVTLGYEVVIGDIDAATWCLTPEIAKRVMQDQTVDAVMPVATFGMPVDAAAWAEFSNETGVPVVIDAAGAYGNQDCAGRVVCTFSLHATKPLGAGEGGFIVTADTALAERITALSQFGLPDDSPWFGLGVNGKLSEYNAAIALAALSHWPDRQKRFLAVREQYVRLLGDRFALQSPSHPFVSALFCIDVGEGHSAEAMSMHLGQQGVGTRLWYRPLMSQIPAYAAALRGNLAVSELLSDRILGLPCGLHLTMDQIESVCRSLG